MTTNANAGRTDEVNAAPSHPSLDYQRVETALRFLQENYLRRPSLAELAGHVGLSEFHFERLFQRWAGTSPKRFLQFLTKQYARQLLSQSASLLETTYALGLSGPGRLHDLFITCEAMTPGDYKARGRGVTIRHGIHPTPFGLCHLALTDKGICSLRFICEDEGAGGQALVAEWPEAEVIEDPAATAEVCGRLFAKPSDRLPFHLHIRGTNFQLKVWQALLLVPPASLVSYSHLASAIGCQGSQRAVGTAVGRNPIGYLIPCHRVIHSLGTFGNYRWGTERKQALIGWEAAQRFL